MLIKSRIYHSSSEILKMILAIVILIFLTTDLSIAQENNLWNSGNFGGPVYYGKYNGNNLYFSQGRRLYKADLTGDNIEAGEANFYFQQALAQFEIEGDNFYAIYPLNSDYQNNIVRSTFSNPGSSSSTQFSGITNGIKKFKVIDGYVLLAHNKDGNVCDKLVGKDFLNNVESKFEYQLEFTDFTINGSIAFLVTTNSIKVIDFSNKTDVTEVASFTVSNATSVYYLNNHIYIACDNGKGLKIYNVSNPSTPSLAGEYETGSFTQIVVNSTTAYLANANQFTTIDVSDVSAPLYLDERVISELSENVLLTDVNNNKICYSDNGIFGLIDAATLTVDKNYLSPVSSDWVHSDGTTLVIFDKLNYYFHSLENKYEPKAFAALAVDEEPIDFRIDGNNFFVATKNKIEIYDLGNLLSPPTVYNLAGEFLFFEISKNFIAVSCVSRRNGSHIYDHLELIDISDLSSPTQLYLKESPVFGRMSSFEFNLYNNVLYVSSEGDEPLDDNYQLIWISTFDISNPSTPQRVTIMELANGETTKGKDVKLSRFNNELYLVTNFLTQNNYYAAKLFAYALTDSLNPALISGLQITQSEYNNVAFLKEMCLVTVPADEEIHMYRLEGEVILRKNWTQEATISIENEANNLTLFANPVDEEESLALRNSKFGVSIKGGDDGEYEYYTSYGSEKTKGTKIRTGTKTKTEEWIVPPPATPKFTVTTSVSPQDAANDKCSLAGAGEYFANENATFTPTAKPGWIPWEYGGDLEGKLVQKNVPVTKNMNVIGVFQPELKLTMSSPDADNHCPPCGQEEDFLIATVYLEAGGVNWDLSAISFEAVGETKPQYIEPFLKVRGNEIQGTIASQGTEFIKFIHFSLSNTLTKDEKLPLELYYRIVVPYENAAFRYSEALNEVKNMAVKTNVEMVSCFPTLKKNRPGIKTPLGKDFISNTQTMANIWNVSTTPEIPFETIELAINDPRTKNGHTIEVCDGYYKYKDATVVDKSLSIIGSGSDNCYIEVNVYRGIFYIKSDNVEISGFSLINKESSEVIDDFNSKIEVIRLFEDIKNIKITENTFYYSLSQFVIIGKNINDLTISNNIYHLEAVANETENALTLSLENCKNTLITNNEFNENNYAITLRDCANAEISKNTFKKVLWEIKTYYTDNLRINENMFRQRKEVDQGYCREIFVNYSKDCRIEFNDFYENKSSIVLQNTDDFIVNTNVNKTSNKQLLLVTSDCKNGSINNNAELSYECSSIGEKNSNINLSTNRLVSVEIENLFGSNIKNNTIQNSPKNSLSITNGDDINISNNEISSSSLNGIYIQNSHNVLAEKNNFNKIKNSAILVSGDSKSTSTTKILHNKIKHKLDKIAILAINLSGNISVINNDIYTANQAIYLQKINTGRIEFNNLYENGEGIKTAQCKDLIISRNYIVDSQEDYTGIHLENTNALVEGNNLVDNNGAAIGLWNNSIAEIRGNNFVDNPDLAIYNETGSVVTSAEDNYWGSSSAPNNEIIDGDVNVNSWLTNPIALVVKAVEDSVQTPSGNNDSTSIAITNFVDGEGLVNLSISDEKGWLTNGGDQSVSLNDSSFTIYNLKYSVPSNAGNNFNNKVTISAISASDENVTAVDSFYILNYTPSLNSFNILPDLITIATNDTLQLNISPLDQYQKEFLGEYNTSWSASHGSIDSTGLFIAPSEESVVTIEVTEPSSGIKSSTQISVLTNPNLPESIIITPDSITVNAESILHFFASGFDKNGFNISVDCEWSTDGGIIDSNGILTVTDQPGLYTVTAKDINSDVEAVAYLTVEAITDIEENIEVIPTEYALNQNYPNPFNPTTVVNYQLPTVSKVELSIYNVLGQKIAVLVDNQIVNAGNYKIQWNASHFSSGVYFLRISAKSLSDSKAFSSVKKMLLVK